MRTSILVLATANLIAAGPIKNVDIGELEKRQFMGTLTTMFGLGGKVADPAGAAPRKQILPTTSKVPGVQRVKMRYGPYSVPNMNKKSLKGEPGTLWNLPDLDIAKPCTECTIVTQQAGLEYADGKNANIDTGMWLHHMVQFTRGPNRTDATCMDTLLSLPHFDIGHSARSAERYFSSGNERTKMALDEIGADGKVGYHVRSVDQFAVIVDLMNMNMEDKIVYLTMTYDIVEGALPSGWRNIRPIWFDAKLCGTSEVDPPQQSGRFGIPSKPWKANFEGDIVAIGAHVHDGGANVDIATNGKPVCNSVAKYGESPEYLFKSRMGHSENYAESHVSSMSACYGNQVTPNKLDKSQSWTINCNYDYDKFPGNKGETGKQESIMCIALMYVAVAPGIQP